MKKAEDNLRKKQADIEGAREGVARGAREVKGMEKDLEDIQKRREKVR